MKPYKACFLFLVVSLASACGPAAGTLPEATGTSLPTATRTDTSTPSPSPTGTFTQTPTPVPSGPCDNPLVPLVAGYTWDYLVTSGGNPSHFTLRVLERADIGNININIELMDHRNARLIQELVLCEEGVIPNFPLYLMSMLLVDYFKGILNTYHVYQSSPYAPAFETFFGNEWRYTWNPQYLLEERVYLVNPAGGEDLSISFSSPIDLVFEATGQFEQVSVPAGIFPRALKVGVSYRMPVSLVDGNAGSASALDIFTTQWYVPYLGLVKARVDQVGLDYYGQPFLVSLASVLELTAFNPRP